LLRGQIIANTFQYLVVRKAYRVYGQLESVTHCTVYSGQQYLVLRMCPEVKILLAGMLALGRDGRVLAHGALSR